MKQCWNLSSSTPGRQAATHYSSLASWKDVMKATKAVNTS